ncbi:hypothetical protein BGZ60DRAFT_425288 [Tricladium varicosporioides]|nr:hypothetical protein BGZ60DRAFT_425288 [Hymenoscyphus varicosporioides]
MSQSVIAQSFHVLVHFEYFPVGVALAGTASPPPMSTMPVQIDNSVKKYGGEDLFEFCKTIIEKWVKIYSLDKDLPKKANHEVVWEMSSPTRPYFATTKIIEGEVWKVSSARHCLDMMKERKMRDYVKRILRDVIEIQWPRRPPRVLQYYLELDPYPWIAEIGYGEKPAWSARTVCKGSAYK